MNENIDIHKIIIRSITNSISQSERALLDAWKAESRANLLEYLDYETIWRESEKLAISKPVDVSVGFRRVRKNARLQKPVRVPFWLNAAAVLALSLLFAGLFSLFTKPVTPDTETFTVYNEIQATYGTQSRLILPDGTIVHLNSGSSMKYPVSFSNLEERRIELIGEGFFEVENLDDKPFIVDVGRLQVEVTGTRFNVDAYSGNQNITVALADGEVHINQVSLTGTNKLATLKPGEIAQLRADENRLYVQQVADMEKYYAWTEGKMVFIDDPIHVVVEKLSNWYNVDIEIADRRLDRYRFTGTFIDEPVEQILAMLSRTSPMGYSIVPSRKLEDNSYTKRRIILKSN
jgi:ferric-dicitrate binding protein FerR (iron transport regulator)